VERRASLHAPAIVDHRGRFSLARVLISVATASFLTVVTIGATSTNGFLTAGNAKAILTASSLVGIVGVGMTLIMISGNLLSLSLGITAAVCAMIFLVALQWGLGVAVVAALAAGAAICGLQGVIVGGWGANPIIITIAAGALQEGFATWITEGRSVLPTAAKTSFEFMARPLAGVPFAVYVLLGTAVLAVALVRRTRFGRNIYSVGDSPSAARAAALSVTRTTTGAFVAAGVCCGIAGVLLAASHGRAVLALSGTLTFDAFAAALVGGTLIRGGKGSVGRTILGALAISTISDLLLLRGYNSGAQILVKGIIVVIVVVLVQLNAREGAR
jgi:ribose/xylose/arabinose/galactoside ABC-type transport system permease subunit